MLRAGAGAVLGRPGRGPPATPGWPAAEAGTAAGAPPAILSGVTNRATSALRLTALAASSALLAGCAVFSPVQTGESYIPADGVDVTIPGLALRNVAVVTAEKGGPGVVIGQAVNNGTSAVDVAFSLQGSSEEPVRTAVPASSGSAISDDTKKVELKAVPAAPGTMVTLVVTTQEAGQNIVSVPVLVDSNYYSGLVSQ